MSALTTAAKDAIKRALDGTGVSIEHAPGLLDFILVDLPAMISDDLKLVITALKDVTALKALDVTTIADKTVIFMEDTNQWLAYDADSAAAEALGPPATVVQPTTGAGRYIALTLGGSAATKAYVDSQDTAAIGTAAVDATAKANAAQAAAAIDATGKADAAALIARDLAMVTNARAATTAPLPACTVVGGTLVGDVVGALAAQDGINLDAGQVLLVKDQGDVKNGPYVVTTVGDGATAFVLTRLADWAVGKAVAGKAVWIREGTQGRTLWAVVEDTGSDLVGTNTLTFQEDLAALAYVDAQDIATLASALAAAKAQINSVIRAEVYTLEDLAGGVDVAARTIMTSRGGRTITGVRVRSRGGNPAGIDDANTSDWAVTKTGAVAVAAKTYATATPFPPEHAMDSLTLDAAPANLDLADGDELILDVTNGAAADLPQVEIVIEWKPKLT